MKTNYIAVLVTGSRDWKGARLIRRVLRDVESRWMRAGECTRFVLVHGCCEGADQIADQAARGLSMSGGDGRIGDWSVLPMPAKWRGFGWRDDKVGLKRNCAMLTVIQKLRECGYTCEVHAFPLPQSTGSPHMMRISKAAGFEVFDHSKLSLPGVSQ